MQAVLPIAQCVLAPSLVGDDGEHQGRERGRHEELLQQHVAGRRCGLRTENTGAHDGAGDADHRRRQQGKRRSAHTECQAAPEQHRPDDPGPAERTGGPKKTQCADQRRRQRHTPASASQYVGERGRGSPVPQARAAASPRGCRRRCPSTSASTCGVSAAAAHLAGQPHRRNANGGADDRAADAAPPMPSQNTSRRRESAEIDPADQVEGLGRRPRGQRIPPATAGMPTPKCWALPSRRPSAGRRRWPASSRAEQQQGRQRSAETGKDGRRGAPGRRPEDAQVRRDRSRRAATTTVIVRARLRDLSDDRSGRTMWACTCLSRWGAGRHATKLDDDPPGAPQRCPASRPVVTGRRRRTPRTCPSSPRCRRGCSATRAVPTSSIRSWSWVTRNTVPSYFCSAMFSALIDSRSRWLVGSSRTSTFGFCSMIRQKSRRAVSPPERASVGLWPSSPLNSICPSRPWMSCRVRVRIELVQPLDGRHPFADRAGVVLREVADRDLVAPAHRPGVDRRRVRVSGRVRQQRLQQRRLADAVAADEHDLLAALDDGVEVADDFEAAVRLRNPCPRAPAARRPLRCRT